MYVCGLFNVYVIQRHAFLIQLLYWFFLLQKLNMQNFYKKFKADCGKQSLSKLTGSDPAKSQLGSYF